MNAKTLFIFLIIFSLLITSTKSAQDSCPSGMRKTYVDDKNMVSYGSARKWLAAVSFFQYPGSLFFQRKVLIEPRFEVHLKAAVDAIRVIENGLATYSKEELLNNRLLYYGLVKQIEIIGEAANMLTHEFRDEHTEVDWRPIVAMRNVLVHDYIHISQDMLWVTITQDIPHFKVHIEKFHKEFK